MKFLREWKFSLSTQLVVLFTLALFPLGLISVYQTWVVARETEDLAARALLAEAQNAAADERKLLYEAIGSAEVIAGAVKSDFDVEFCSLLTSQFIQSQDVFVWAGVLEIDGRVRCSSNHVRLRLKENSAILKRVRKDERGFFSHREGRASGQSVLVAYAPVYNKYETIGITAVSIPHGIANRTLANASDGLDFSLTTLNKEGDILSSSVGIDAAEDLLPAGLPFSDIIDRTGSTFKMKSNSGESQIYAVAELISDEVFLLGSRPLKISQSLVPIDRARLALIFPILMWAASLTVALFGLHRLVLRHLRDLRSAMRRFALGEREDPFLELKDAPPELEEAQRAFNRMVVILSEAEARTLQDLQEKTVLLREVHHRVKNNLQMVASIMNMQMRKVNSPEAKQVLSQLQNRVRGLATIHRSLYTKPDLTTVSGSELVTELISELGVEYFASTHPVRLEVDLDEVPLYPDQAVPVSMFLSEAMTNAIKYAGIPDGKSEAWIGIKLSLDDNTVRLSIENSLGEPIVAPSESCEIGSGLGMRLMQAFTSQLDGHDKVEQTDLTYCHEVCFQMQPAMNGDVKDADPTKN
ncbi:histidine kinase dimerization/phosphoacceptor domain -containing protein [Roseovarius aestuariivivens]|uniref:histidine kinase dimerization/phosphoacceptor domain -containing protein n=1 Tax=Roseovarius aestuariivivens TaxID=1888910 RepID=UPI0010804DA2|nr:histidine kinase dimerization/phosphoacceptor domain -containing protein [Roseovarius aestuariivivens]